MDKTIKMIRGMKWEEIKGGMFALCSTYKGGSSAQIELEKAFQHLIDGIEASGIIEDSVAGKGKVLDDLTSIEKEDEDTES